MPRSMSVTAPINHPPTANPVAAKPLPTMGAAEPYVMGFLRFRCAESIPAPRTHRPQTTTPYRRLTKRIPIPWDLFGVALALVLALVFALALALVTQQV